MLCDPLDGSANIDANVSVCTIFSIHRVESGLLICFGMDLEGDGEQDLVRAYRYAAIPVTCSPRTSVWMLCVPS